MDLDIKYSLKLVTDSNKEIKTNYLATQWYWTIYKHIHKQNILQITGEHNTEVTLMMDSDIGKNFLIHDIKAVGHSSMLCKWAC